MERFELTGSGISDGQDPQRLLQLAKQFGLRNPRVAFHMGMSNQPQTIRFTAADWHAADKLADQIRSAIYPENTAGHLCPMIRAYPVKTALTESTKT